MKLLVGLIILCFTLTAASAFAVCRASARPPALASASSSTFTECWCKNNHTVQHCPTCTVNVTLETYEAGKCNPMPACDQTTGCSGSYSYFLSGVGTCSGSYTAACTTSCGGSCTSNARCVTLTITCAQCTEIPPP